MEEILNTDHESDKDVSLDTDAASLFADAGACVLSPEVTEGPLCKPPPGEAVPILSCLQPLWMKFYGVV